MPAKPFRHASLGTPLSLAVIAAFVIIAFTGSSDSALGATQPRCGDTITADTTLHHNLVNCPNNGIVIGADNITLDLNYHTIDGDGAPASGCDPDTEFCDVGVFNRGHDGVTVIAAPSPHLDASPNSWSRSRRRREWRDPASPD